MPSDIPDYYEILGVVSDASLSEIRTAYRSLARAFHPDISTHPNAKEQFLKISEAYRVLSDAELRSEYDRKYMMQIEDRVNFEENSSESADVYDDEYNAYDKYNDAYDDYGDKDEEDDETAHDGHDDDCYGDVCCGGDDDGDDEEYDEGDDDEYDDGDEDDGDEFSRSADYEYYADEEEVYRIDGVMRRFTEARHIIIDDCDYLICDGRAVKTGTVCRFIHKGSERYRIDGREYLLENAEHCILAGREYVIIEGTPYLIKSI